jgi:hypothetical protein
LAGGRRSISTRHSGSVRGPPRAPHRRLVHAGDLVRSGTSEGNFSDFVVGVVGYLNPLRNTNGESRE